MDHTPALPEPIRSDSRPLYLQTTEALISYLSNGSYGPGDRLPTENEMAEYLGISRATLRVAMGYLETRGHIVRRPGLGTFVAAPVILREPRGFNLALDRLEPILSVAAQLDLEATIVEREIDLIPATDEWAAKLDVPAGSELVHCQIVESIEGKVGAFLDILIPASLVEISELRRSEVDPMTCLAAHEEIEPLYTQSKISATGAEAAVARKLQIAEGTPVLQLVETFYGNKGHPVILATNHFLTDVVGFYIMRRIRF